MENKRDLKQGSKILRVGIMLIGLIFLFGYVMAQDSGGNKGNNKNLKAKLSDIVYYLNIGLFNKSIGLFNKNG